MSDAQAPSPDSVDDALRADHERLDALLRGLKASIGAGSAAAREGLSRLSVGLLYHMAWEDEWLFPAVKSRAGAKERRSVESLEIDHERLRETLRDLDLSLAAGDLGASESLVRWLETLLKGHNYDEEHGAYVEADRLLEAGERRRLMKRFLAGRPAASD